MNSDSPESFAPSIRPGTPITINLQYGETIEVDEDHIIALLNIAENQMQSNWSLGNLLGGEGLSMMRVTGTYVIVGLFGFALGLGAAGVTGLV